MVYAVGVMVGFLRYGFFVVLVLVGFVIFFMVDSNACWDGWVMCVGFGFVVLLLNWLFWMGVKGDCECDDEIVVREYFVKYGYWLDEV